MTLDKKTLIEMNGFLATFELYPVNDEWRDEIHNYFIKGWPPGSFHTAVLANDLTGAVFKSHPMNEWKQIREFVKWVFANAPDGSWGSYENVDAWLKLSTATRRKICENIGWLVTEKELTWKIVSDKG